MNVGQEDGGYMKIMCRKILKRYETVWYIAR